MTAPAALALDERRQAGLAGLDFRVTQEMLALWALLRWPHPQESFVETVLPGMLSVLAAGQEAAAAIGAGYVDQVAKAAGAPSGARVNTASLVGVAADGRPLARALSQPLVGTYRALAGGIDLRQATQVGMSLVEQSTVTEIHDAARVSSEVATAANRAFTGYRRSVEARACGRCVILAGRFYRWNDGFLRHPRCRCANIPVQDRGDTGADPRALFDAMSREDQERAFGVDGADAIRLGADPSRVVNARKGMGTTDMLGQRVKTTKVLADRKNARLMPESIFRLSESRDEAIRLLRFHKYIL
jgi:hypothetical protein